MNADQLAPTAPATPELLRWQDADERKRRQFLAEAQRGDRRAIEMVMSGAKEDADLREQLMNLPGHARQALITTACGAANVLMRGALLEQVKRLEDELTAESVRPSALERMLVERVVTCWLAAHLADLEAEGRMQSSALLAVAAASFYEQRRERAHARYLSASLALAKVRRLLRPGRGVTQINIVGPGTQQLKRRRDGD